MKSSHYHQTLCNKKKKSSSVSGEHRLEPVDLFGAQQRQCKQNHILLMRQQASYNHQFSGYRSSACPLWNVYSCCPTTVDSTAIVRHKLGQSRPKQAAGDGYDDSSACCWLHYSNNVSVLHDTVKGCTEILWLNSTTTVTLSGVKLA